MSSLNKVQIIGHLGKDPETRSFANGGKVTSFSVATSESWTDKASGERQTRTEWHAVVIKNERLAEVAERYLEKGSQVYVEGSIQSRKYIDRDGNERSITEIVLGQFRGELVLLSRKSGGSSGDDKPFTGVAMPQRTNGRERRTVDSDLDDQIPF
jgi:single-strand DNA-binding protein